MIRINQLKLSLKHTPEDLRRKAAKLLHIAPEEILSLDIVRRSLDARKKDNILFSYTVEAALSFPEAGGYAPGKSARHYRIRSCRHVLCPVSCTGRV